MNHIAGKAPLPRLGFYCPGTGSGGPWRYVHSMIAGLDPCSFRITLFCDMVGEYPGRPDIELVPLKPVVTSDATSVTEPALAPAPRSSWLPKSLKIWAGFFKDARRLARLFREHPVQILHTQSTGCEESPVAAKMAGIPHVIGTFHVNPSIDHERLRSGPTHRILEMISNRCLDRAVAVSEATRKAWISRTHLPPVRVVTIRNGINPEVFKRRLSRLEAKRNSGISADSLVIGCIARLDEAKGLSELISAAASLRSRYPQLQVVIAGSGPFQARLETQIASLNLEGVVRLLGFQADVQRVLDAWDVFAFPSWDEALPYALLEAMATELPVVATRVGGIPEVVVDSDTGFLVPKRDPAALANKLALLLDHPELRLRMGVAGRMRVVSCFNEQQMVRETLAVYTQQGSLYKHSLRGVIIDA
jgi:glycosyltransferase involved in cell wall biosynthesis